MDRSAFAYLYMHANSLSELGFEQAAQGMLDELDSQPDPLAHLSEDEREALALEQLRAARERYESGEETGLDKVYRDAAARPLEPFESLQPLQPLDDAEAPAPSEPVERDLGEYLAKVYAAQAELAERVDQAMAQLDLAQLDAAVAALPTGLPPLTAPLDAAGFGQWLQLYAGGDPALDELVTTIRFAEFS